MYRHSYDPNLHLLFDPEDLHQVSNNAVLIPGRLNRRRAPVLVADRPWEGRKILIGFACGTVLHNEGEKKFRMWYRPINELIPPPHVTPHPGACYAESDDGIHWVKPDLGLCEFDGSKDNNICFGPGIIPSVPDANYLLVHPNEQAKNEDERYMGLVFGQDPRMYEVHFPQYSDEQRAEFRKVLGHYVVASPDGVNWRWTGRKLSLLGDRYGFGRDRIRNEWIVPCSGYMHQTGLQFNGTPYIPRQVAIQRSSDLETFSPLEHPFFLGQYEQFGAVRDHHTLHPFTYGNRLLGLLDLAVVPSYLPEVEIVVSPDGRRWNRPLMGFDFLPEGPVGQWDAENACLAASDPIRVGDELYFYYHGRTPARTFIGFGGVETRHEKPHELLQEAAIGLATLRLDGFAGWRTHSHHPENEAFVTIRPVEVAEPELQVNFDSIGGYVRVEICGESFERIEGFWRDDCIKMDQAGVRQVVRFKDNRNLAELVGKRVHIRFLFTNGTLFSYRFADSADDD